MLLPPFEPHELLKLIRLFTGLNQSQMATNLGVTQSWLSRLEAGKGELTLLQLANLRSSMGVSADEIIDGAVPFLSQAARFQAQIPLPAKYTEPATARMLDLYPFLRLLLEAEGEKTVQKILRNFKVPAHLVAEPRLAISPVLVSDVIAICDEYQLLNHAESWPKLVEYSLNERVIMPELVELRAQNGGPGEIIRRFLGLSYNFNSGYTQSVNEQQTASLDVVVKKPAQLAVAPAPGLHLCRFKRELIREVGCRLSGKDLHLQEVSCQFGTRSSGHAEVSDENCVYHVSWA